MELHVLSAGAAQALVKAMAELFRAETGAVVHGDFGAVGAIRAKLLAGARCDLVILTAAQIADLERDGRVVAGGSAPLGRVRTGVAIREREAVPDIATADALRATLVTAKAIYIPDPRLATAGIHFMGVLGKLGIADALEPRLRSFPNGATAMGALAQSTAPGEIGCTQITEIRYTPGVVLVGALPAQFELATVYTVGLCTESSVHDLAQRFLAMLTGERSQALRAAGGFEARR